MRRNIFLQHPFFAPEPEGGSGGGADPVTITPEQAIEALQGNDGYVVMSAADFKKKEQSIRKDEAINSVGKTHGIYDGFFQELSGLEKEENEKTVDYGKRAVSSILEKAQGKPNEQITSLKTQLEDTKSKYATLQADLEQKDKDFQSQLLKRDIQAEFQKGLFGIMPKLAYDSDNEKELALIGFERKFFDTYEIKLEDGTMQVFDKASGKVLQDKALKDLQPAQVVQEFAQSMLKFSNSASKGGAGTKSPSNNGTPALNSIEDLDNYLKDSGLIVGSKEWLDKREKLRKELAI